MHFYTYFLRKQRVLGMNNLKQTSLNKFSSQTSNMQGLFMDTKDIALIQNQFFKF